MDAPPALQIRKPRQDDRPIWDVLFGIFGYPAVLVAHNLKLFPLLAEKPLTISELCDALKIERRPAEALLAVCASLSFIQLVDGRYATTPVADDYLLESSPASFCGYLDLVTNNFPVWLVDSLIKAVLINASASLRGWRHLQNPRRAGAVCAGVYVGHARAQHGPRVPLAGQG